MYKDKCIIFIQLLILIIIINSSLNNEIKLTENENNFMYNNIYTINSYLNNYYFSYDSNYNLVASNRQTNFRLIHIISNSYYIQLRGNKKLGIDKNNKIIFYNYNNNIINDDIIKWNIIKIDMDKFLIQNYFNKKYIEEFNGNFICLNDLYSYKNEKNINIQNKFFFNIFQLFKEGLFNKKHLNIIKKESIDILIKYIDLNDKTINRTGINQIYKDNDNNELKYSLRSILNYIPWVRKIFILMPNEKVKYFKSIDIIQDKIIYIKDKDLLGFESANIQAFLFNLYKMKEFGISTNFIYIEDDYFFGKRLEKQDFFYYDEINKKVMPYIITTDFFKINNDELYKKYNNLYEKKDRIHPHSSEGFWLGYYSTQKFFLEHYKIPIISTEFTHNAISENIEDLNIIFNEALNYKYFNETLYSKERYILTLIHQLFLNLYLLNIKNQKVHSIKYKYISIEKVNKFKLNYPLFVINTGGNHIPLNRQYKIQKKVMEKYFNMPTKYEINYQNNIIIKNSVIEYLILFKSLIIIFFIKV